MKEVCNTLRFRIPHSHLSKVGNDVITINMCLREGDHGWQPPDKGVIDFFKQAPDASDHPKTHHFFAAFLYALAVKVEAKLGEWKKRRQPLATVWFNFMEPVDCYDRKTRRQGFFGSMESCDGYRNDVLQLAQKVKIVPFQAQLCNLTDFVL